MHFVCAWSGPSYLALAAGNASLKREGFEAFYAEDERCFLRHIATNSVAFAPSPVLGLGATEARALGGIPRRFF